MGARRASRMFSNTFRKDIQIMNRTFLVTAAVVGITTGALFATYNHEAKQYSENASRIIEMGELAQPVKPRSMHLVDYICQNNSRITRDMAEGYVCAVESILAEYKADPAYSTGVAPFIEAEHIVALIVTESRGDMSTKGSAGETGLTQIIPRFHAKALHKAGILPSMDPSYLWDAERNIEGGIFILMNIARGVDRLDRAFSRYNAGYRERAGRAYARKIMSMVNEIKKGESI